MISAYFFEAHFQVVLRLLLIVRKRLVDEKLLFDVDLRRKNNNLFLRLRTTSNSFGDLEMELTIKYGLLRLYPSDTNVTSLTNGISPCRVTSSFLPSLSPCVADWPDELSTRTRWPTGKFFTRNTNLQSGSW